MKGAELNAMRNHSFLAESIRRPFAKWLLCLALFLVVSLQLTIYLNGFIDVSGDGFLRALMAYEWRQSFYLVTRDFGNISLFWFTPYFWLTGVLYWLTGNLTLALVLVSSCSSLLGLLVLHRLVRLLIGEPSALVTLLLVGLLPYHIWLSVSMAESTLYLLFVLLALLYLVHWIQGQRIKDILISAFFFLACSMIRPEGWLLAGSFSLYAVYLLVRGRKTNLLGLGFGALIPLLFIFFWLGDNWLTYGNPFHFVINQKAHIDDAGSLSSMPSLIRATQPVFFMAILSPLLLPLIAAGVVVKRRSFSKELWFYLLFVSFHLGLLIAMFLFGVGTTAAPQRYGLTVLVLLAPFAGWLLADGLKMRRWRWAVLSFGLVYVSLCVYKSFSFSSLYEDAVTAATYVKDQRMDGIPVGRIATDYDIRKQLALPYASLRDYQIDKCSYAALASYSGRPDAFLSNPLRISGPGSIQSGQGLKVTDDDGTSELHRFLRDSGVNAILLRNRVLMERLPVEYKWVRSFGRYGMFMASPSVAKKTRLRPAVDPGEGLLLAPGVRLLDHRYEGSLFPVDLVLRLAVVMDPKVVCQQQFAVISVRSHADDESLIRHFQPTFCLAGAMARTSIGSMVTEEHLALELPITRVAGFYRNEISLVPTKAAKVRSESEDNREQATIDLSPVWLAYNKRSALQDYLKGRNRDWKLLLFVLNSL